MHVQRQPSWRRLPGLPAGLLTQKQVKEAKLTALDSFRGNLERFIDPLTGDAIRRRLTCGISIRFELE